MSPIAFNLGPISVHWYGLMYLLAFALAWGLALWRTRDSRDWNRDEVGDMIFYAALGVVLGGRIGYMIFYALSDWLANPLLLFKVWKGGMSFHGGLLGVLVSLYIFSRRMKKPWVSVMDFSAPLVPLGLGAGRLGNFINGELWGRVTDMPWAMVFPNAGPWPRHPSQLYEAFFEGLVLFVIMWLYSSKPRLPWAVSSLFLLAYGSIRFCLEFFRQPDPQYGFIALGWLTMGQLLSIPMVLVGLYVFLRVAYRPH